MAQLRELLAERLDRAAEPPSTFDLDELAVQLAPGEPRRKHNPALAAALLEESPETVDKSSREYRNALRNVQRWRRGTTTPGAESYQKIARAARWDKATQQRVSRAIGDRGQGVSVSMRGTYLPQREPRYEQIDRRLPATGAVQLTSGQLDPVAAAAADGDWRNAAIALNDAFFDALAEQYPSSGTQLNEAEGSEWIDVDELDIEPE
jgi:hypothetical protein